MTTATTDSPTKPKRKPKRKRMIQVYVAGPYRGPSESAVFANIMRARDYAQKIWDMPGLLADCPHLNTCFFGDGSPAEKWLDGDLEKLSRCDAVFLMPGWRNSEGAVGEYEFAKAEGIPCFETLDFLRRYYVNGEPGAHHKGILYPHRGSLPETAEPNDFDDLLESERKTLFDIPPVGIKLTGVREPPEDTRSLKEIVDEVISVWRDLCSQSPPEERKSPSPAPTILEEAMAITSGQRREDYGGVHADFTRTAAMWSEIIEHPVSARHVPLCMIALKIAREVHKPKRDNRVDIAGYAQCLDALMSGVRT